MEEFIENNLADGEDDEKRIQRADIRAEKKLKSAKGAKNKKGSGPQSSKKSWPASAQAGRGPSTDGTMAQLIAALLPTIDKMSRSSSGIQAGRSLQQLGPCFMCGKQGHLRKSCPLLLGTANK